MANDTSLVVFYSRTGFTRTVAEALASALGADLGSGPERTFRHMAAACGKTPLATMAVRDREVRSALQDARIRELVGRVQEAAAAR